MSCLRNFRRELYARELVEAKLAGLSRPDYVKARLKAYTSAGYAPSPDNARRDENRPDVKARVGELFAEALEYRDVRAAAVLTRIDRVGRANVVDFFEAQGDADGRVSYRLKDITKLPRELTEALASLEWDENGRPKLKLWDKNQANFTLLKHLGGIPDDNDKRPNVVNIFAGLSVDDQRALAEALEALAAGPATIDLEAAAERSAG